MRISLAVMVTVSVIAIAIMVYSLLTTNYSWGMQALCIPLFIAMPIYWHRKLKKIMLHTRLEITDVRVTLSIPSYKTQSVKFTDIEIVDKNKHSLALVPKGKGRSIFMLMISDKFEGYAEIMAKIDESIERSQFTESA